MIRRLLVTAALLIVFAWTLHTLVLAGGILLDQHPFAMLRISPAVSHQYPVDGTRQAINVAAQLMPAGASVAIVYPAHGRINHFTPNYTYYWATYKMYPRRVVIADSVTEAAAGAPDYILDIGDPLPPADVQPAGYRSLQTTQFYDGVILTVLVRA